MSELKPCPFCGKPPKYSEKWDGFTNTRCTLTIYCCTDMEKIALTERPGRGLAVTRALLFYTWNCRALPEKEQEQ